MQPMPTSCPGDYHQFLILAGIYAHQLSRSDLIKSCSACPTYTYIFRIKPASPSGVIHTCLACNINALWLLMQRRRQQRIGGGGAKGGGGGGGRGKQKPVKATVEALQYPDGIPATPSPGLAIAFIFAVRHCCSCCLCCLLL